MKCPTCHAASNVLETRDWKNGFTRRVRECHNGHRFHSYEVTEGYLNATARRRLTSTAAQHRKRAERIRQFMRANPDTPRAAVARKFGVSSGRARALWRELNATEALK